MKIAVNLEPDWFEFSIEALAILGKEFNLDNVASRTDARLIKLLEEKGTDFVSMYRYSQLKVIEIPDEVTDWKICEYYDGLEMLVYVLNGKLHIVMNDEYPVSIVK